MLRNITLYLGLLLVSFLFSTIIPFIISSHCFSIGCIALIRLNTLKVKKESVIFFILCLSTAAWALTPYIKHFNNSYGWITGLLITNAALVYVIVVTDIKTAYFFLPLSLISITMVIYMLVTGNPGTPEYQLKYALSVYPLLFIMNIVLYIYYIKYKAKFLLHLAVICSFMVVCGLYENFMKSLHWPIIPAATIASFGFILIIGYNLIGRGYLKDYGWSDYIGELEEKEKLLREKFYILKKANFDSVVILSQTIEAKDPYTRGHCIRVHNYAKAIGQKLKFNKERLMFLEFGAILHDIGKIGIPGFILNKAPKLTDEEFSLIKKHPDIGANIVSDVEFFKPIIPMIRTHHEFYNGKGYPSGLKGEEIPLEARILAVCDVFDAMTSDRPYRKAFSVEKALSILNEVKGIQLDPDIVDIFVKEKIYQIQHHDKLQTKFDF